MGFGFNVLHFVFTEFTTRGFGVQGLGFREVWGLVPGIRVGQLLLDASGSNTLEGAFVVRLAELP